MRIKCKWILNLDIKFAIKDGVESRFVLNPDLFFEFSRGRNKFFYDTLEITYMKDAEDLEADESNGKVFFIEDLMREIGPLANRMYLSISRNLHLNVTNIYNGEDFAVPFYVFLFDDKETKIGGYDAASSAPSITKETYSRIIDDYNQGDQDLVEQLIYQANNFLNLGFIDIALLTAYISLEVEVKRKFKPSLFKTNLEYQIFRNTPERQFITKYLDYGPYFCYRKTYSNQNPEIFQSMITLDRLRNLIAHEGTSLHDKIFNGYQYDDIYYIAEDIIDNAEDVIKWLDSLDGPFNYYEEVEILSDEPNKTIYKNKTGTIIDTIKSDKGWNYLVSIKNEPVAIHCNPNEIKKINR